MISNLNPLPPAAMGIAGAKRAKPLAVERKIPQTEVFPYC